VITFFLGMSTVFEIIYFYLNTNKILIKLNNIYDLIITISCLFILLTNYLVFKISHFYGQKLLKVSETILVYKGTTFY